MNDFLKSKNLMLQLVQEEDASFILSLRQNGQLGKYLSPTNITVEEQKKWICEYKQREKDQEEFYFKAVSHDGINLGFVRLYHIDYEHKELTFGSFIMRVDRPKFAAIETMILAVLISFKYLNMDKVLLDVRVKNEHAKHFYQRFGFQKYDENELDEFYELTRTQFFKLYDEKYKGYV